MECIVLLLIWYAAFNFKNFVNVYLTERSQRTIFLRISKKIRNSVDSSISLHFQLLDLKPAIYSNTKQCIRFIEIQHSELILFHLSSMKIQQNTITRTFPSLINMSFWNFCFWCIFEAKNINFNSYREVSNFLSWSRGNQIDTFSTIQRKCRYMIKLISLEYNCN